VTSGGGAGSVLFLFQDTTQVLWAEEVAEEEGIPVEIVPAPQEAENLCGLAIETLPDRTEKLRGLLEDEGIPFLLHTRRE
jgi:hypothetical protein